MFLIAINDISLEDLPI